MQNPTKTAFFISGSGSTMESIIKSIQNKTLLGITPAVVISSNKNSPGLPKAKALGVPTKIADRKSFETPDDFGSELIRICEEFNVELISNNGWLPLTPKNVIDAFRGSIINQHPGPLDPGGNGDFGGAGMYGARVLTARFIYEWVIDDRAPWTEATVHFVTEEFDKGDLIHSTNTSLPGPKKYLTIDEITADKDLQNYLKETVINFQKEFLPIEHQNVIEALSLFSFGKKPGGFRRDSSLIDTKNISLLDQSKKLAIELFPKG